MEVNMTSGKEKLLSLLFNEGRELVNFRFFPGEHVTSPDDLCEASHDALRSALESDQDSFPALKKLPIAIGDLVQKL
jgi:hypothetical protein